MSKPNRHIGSPLDDFLREEGVLDESRAIAIKETVAFQIQRTMETEKISKIEMSRRMKTSRAALDRFREAPPSRCKP
jgi:antitoxin HicB